MKYVCGFWNRLLNRIFGPKREEVAWSCRRLCNEELHNLCATYISKVIKLSRMRCMVHVACMGEMRNAYKNLVGKHEGKRLLGKPTDRYEYNIRMDSSFPGGKAASA